MRCSYMSPTYYRGVHGLVQCDRDEGHFPETNHNIAEADFFVSIGLEPPAKYEADRDAIAIVTGLLG